MRLHPGITAMLEAEGSDLKAAETRYVEYLARRRKLGEHFEYESCPVGCRGAGLSDCSLAVLRPWSWLSKNEQRQWTQPTSDAELDALKDAARRHMELLKLDPMPDPYLPPGDLHAIYQHVNKGMADALGWPYGETSPRRPCGCPTNSAGHFKACTLPPSKRIQPDACAAPGEHGYYCSLDPQHSGEHQAWENGKVFHAWPRVEVTGTYRPIRLYVCFNLAHHHESNQDIEIVAREFHYHTAPVAEALAWYRKDPLRPAFLGGA